MSLENENAVRANSKDKKASHLIIISKCSASVCLVEYLHVTKRLFAIDCICYDVLASTYNVYCEQIFLLTNLDIFNNISLIVRVEEIMFQRKYSVTKNNIE